MEGRAPARADTTVRSAATGGAVIGRLTGVSLPLRVSELPSDPRQGLVRLATGGSATAPMVRIDGFAPLDAVETFAARDLRVVGKELWITTGQKVRVVAVSGMTLTVEHDILGSRGQKLRTDVPCDAVALAPPHADEAAPGGAARGYQMRHATLDLYDAPNGSVVYTLELEEDARKLFFGSELRGGSIHLLARGDITIDAWARVGDLSMLATTEVFDTSLPDARSITAKTLAIDPKPPVVTATAELPIHAKPENGTPIGYVEPGARFFTMERSDGWVNIWPEDLGVMPPDGGGFWIRTSGLPPAPPAPPPAG